MTIANRFTGRRAVVTGGVSGIGLGIATRLAAEGARVSLWDMNAARLAEVAATLGAGTHIVALDLTDPDAVARAAITTRDALGGIDVLVASAGITGPTATLVDYPIDAWKRVMDVNVNGVFYCNRSVVPVMVAGGYGRIVNIASIAGKEGNPNASAYSTSKAAVIGLTKSLGKELAKTNVRVNAVAPAVIQTPILEQVTEEFIQFMLSKIPMGRFGLVEEVASLVCWLASEECSFSTGAVFDVSGGRATY